MKNLLFCILLSINIVGCSTRGGIYKAGDSEDGEFSVGNTALSIIGIVGAIAIIKDKGGGGGGQPSGYAWDYQTGNRQWVCRDRSNGEYALVQNCANLAKIDNWPNN